MRIMEFEPEDYKDVQALWSAAGISTGASDSYEEILKFHRYNKDTLLVGTDENTGGIIAVCMGGYDGRRGYIHHLAVRPEYQKNKFGSEILDEVLQRLKRKGVLKVHLFIESRNSGAVGFYEKALWERRDDLIVMSKFL